MSSATSESHFAPDAVPAWMLAGAWVGAMLWAGTIFWFSSRTGPEIEEMNPFELWDKAAHFIAFAAGAPSLYLALLWSSRDRSKRRAIILTAVLLALYGAGDEVHQLYTPNRSGADVYDWMADALGGLIGTFATAFIHARTPRIHAQPRFAGGRDPARPAPTGNPGA